MSETNQKQPINLGKIMSKLWRGKWWYFTICPTVLILTYLFMVTVPRYYKCDMELAPESTKASGAGSLSSLASSFGISGLSKLAGNDDAISPELYPDLLKSPDFIVTLFNIEIATKDDKLKTNYYDYLVNHQPQSWFSENILGPIMEWIEPPVKSSYTGKTKVDVRHLDKQQQDIVTAIANKIKCNVDKKTGAVSISVQDCDPNVCATIGDSVLQRMQAFIIDYRTKKARIDYKYYQKLCDDSKTAYEKARNKYAAISDSDMEVMLQTVKSKIEDMENDMQLKYNTYSALQTQAQAAQAKIQENTPVFTVIQSATVPQKPAGPKRMIISIFVTMLAFIIVSIVIVVKYKDKDAKAVEAITEEKANEPIPAPEA